VTADDDGPAAGGDLSVYLRFSRRVGRRDPREPRTRRAYPGGYGDSLLGIKRCEADDGAPIVAEVALAAPRSGIVEIAGPERAPFNEIVARYLKAVGDPREVVRDPEARYWGGRVEEHSLVPLGEARLGHISLDEWLRRSQAGA
jgi:uncharacterized protein YbjT (DUF2867 family)